MHPESRDLHRKADGLQFALFMSTHLKHNEKKSKKHWWETLQDKHVVPWIFSTYLQSFYGYVWISFRFWNVEMTSTAPNGFVDLFDFFVFISIFVSPLSLVFTPLSTSVFPFLLYITPTVFRLVSLYELLLYLNFRIVLERVKQKEEYDKM